MSKFQIDDIVVVTREEPEWEWWVPSMSNFVGKEGRVIDFEEEPYSDPERWRGTDPVFPRVRFVSVDDDGDETPFDIDFFFPEWVLKLASPPEKLESAMSIFELMGGSNGS